MADTHCPWSGARNCGCGVWPSTRNGAMPERCQERLSLPLADMHGPIRAPLRADEVKRWIAAGRPRLDRWAGEDDGD